MNQWWSLCSANATEGCYYVILLLCYFVILFKIYFDILFKRFVKQSQFCQATHSSCAFYACEPFLLIPRVKLRVSKGNAGACFATQPSAELLQSTQLEVLQSMSWTATEHQRNCYKAHSLQPSFARPSHSMCSLKQLVDVSEQPCYRAGCNVSVLLVLRTYM